MAGANPFDIVKNLFEKREPVGLNSDTSVNFMLGRAMSMSNEGLVPAIIANQVSAKIPKYLTLGLLYYNAPKMSRAPFGKYIKKPGAKETDKYKAVIKLMADHYHVSQPHAEEIFEILTKQGKDMYAVFGNMLKTKKVK